MFIDFESDSDPEPYSDSDSDSENCSYFFDFFIDEKEIITLEKEEKFFRLLILLSLINNKIIKVKFKDKECFQYVMKRLRQHSETFIKYDEINQIVMRGKNLCFPPEIYEKIQEYCEIYKRQVLI